VAIRAPGGIGAGAVPRLAAARGLEALDALDRDQFSHPHVLDVFKANMLTGMGRSDEARALFLDHLRRSPWLAAAYKDLGDLYYARYEMSRAWLCWEIGRSIAPGHPNWGKLRAYEDRLRKEFARIL
jgi:hypothetical protein